MIDGRKFGFVVRWKADAIPYHPRIERGYTSGRCRVLWTLSTQKEKRQIYPALIDCPLVNVPCEDATLSRYCAKAISPWAHLRFGAFRNRLPCKSFLTDTYFVVAALYERLSISQIRS